MNQPAPKFSVLPEPPEFSLLQFPQSEPVEEIKPDYLQNLKGRLREIYVYSQWDAIRSDHRSDQFSDPKGITVPLLPGYGEYNLVDLGGEFPAEQVQKAIQAMEDGEDPAVTALRETIFYAADKKLYLAAKDIEDVHKHGISDDLPIGALAFEN